MKGYFIKCEWFLFVFNVTFPLKLKLFFIFNHTKSYIIYEEISQQTYILAHQSNIFKHVANNLICQYNRNGFLFQNHNYIVISTQMERHICLFNIYNQNKNDKIN